MKKGFASILLLLYFAFSSGVVINMHYCMNRLDSFQLGAVKSEICGKCSMYTVDANGCCHDDVKVIKIEDGHHASALNFQFAALAAISPVYDEYDNDPASAVYNTAVNNHSPPLSRRYTYLQNCVFRI